jgi:hypothetical protein
VINGQMMSSVDTLDQVKLAIVWYNPDGRGDPIIPQEISYQSAALPAFSVPLYEPPPASAIYEATGYRMALGAVVAYVDRNSNGKLDVIPKGGRPIDLILAASWPRASGDADGFGLLYVDRPLDDSGDLHPGYQLVQGSGATIRASGTSAQLRMQLTRSAWNNLAVCTAGASLNWDDAPSRGDLLACTCQSDGLRVFGGAKYGTLRPGIALGTTDDSVGAQAGPVGHLLALRLSVFDCSGAFPPARVTLNDSQLDFHPAQSIFTNRWPLVQPRQRPLNSMVVTAEDYAPLLIELPSSQFQIFYPYPGQTTISRTGLLLVSWTDMNSTYAVSLRTGAGVSLFERSAVTEHTLAIPPLSYVGSATLSVHTVSARFRTDQGSEIRVVHDDAIRLSLLP